MNDLLKKMKNFFSPSERTRVAPMPSVQSPLLFPPVEKVAAQDPPSPPNDGPGRGSSDEMAPESGTLDLLAMGSPRSERSAEPEAAANASLAGGLALLEEAKSLVDANSLESALEVLGRVEAGTPQWAAAQFERALVLNRLSRLNEAIAAASEATGADSEQPAYFALLGNLLVRAGRAADAEGPLSRAVALGTSDLWAYINMGYMLAGSQRPEEAIEVIRCGLEVLPDDPHLTANLGRFLFEAQQVEAADAVLAQAAERADATAMAHGFRAPVLRALGDVEGAVESLRKAVALQPDHAVWRRELGRMEDEAPRRAKSSPMATPATQARAE